MENLVSYRNNDYFNSEDYYLLQDTCLYYVTKLHRYNGSWYCNNRLQFKCTSVPITNMNELLGTRVTRCGKVGKITKFTDDAIGVYWGHGLNADKSMNPFWNDAKDLKTL